MKNKKGSGLLLSRLVLTSLLISAISLSGCAPSGTVESAAAAKIKTASADDIAAIAQGSEMRDDVPDPIPTTFADMVKPKEINACLADFTNDPDTLLLLAAGNVSISEDTTPASDGSSDYSQLYKNIAERVGSADIAVIAQDTDLSPGALKAVTDAGFDYPASADAADPAISGGIYFIKAKEINAAFIAEKDDPGTFEDRIQKAADSSDVVIAFTANGGEETGEVSESRKEKAQKAADLGADIIIDGSSHILQDLSVITRNADGALVPVSYCPGDLVPDLTAVSGNGQTSNGDKQAADGNEKVTGGILEFVIKKDADSGAASPVAMQFIPVSVEFSGTDSIPSVKLLTDIKPASKKDPGAESSEDTETAGFLESHINKRYINQSCSISAW